MAKKELDGLFIILFLWSFVTGLTLAAAWAEYGLSYGIFAITGIGWGIPTTICATYWIKRK